ncbi:MAG: helix-turn-helix transcriptional regulator [Bacteroidetes bacterium]|nr:helix-turn-helix transcriptional regulator [Bacteroidota bacterium]
MRPFITIPQDLFAERTVPAEPLEGTALRMYESAQPSEKSRVIVKQHFFSFVMEGRKLVHRNGEPLQIGQEQFLFIGEGNCLMTEKLSLANRYSSLLFFFDDRILRSFFAKYPALAARPAAAEPFVCLERDAFVKNYLGSLLLLMQGGCPDELRVLKLEELLLYLAGKYPRLSFSFQPVEEQDLRAAVEGNWNQVVSVEELAWVCNMSLSTFKRKFARVYGTTPNRWLLQRRMERAVELLNQQEKPSEVYHKVGYENHSSFTQSFKQIYGVTPSEYLRGVGVD